MALDRAGVRLLTVNVGSTSLKVGLVVDGTAVAGPGTLEATLAAPPPDAVVHRIVHGGDRVGPTLVDDDVMSELRALTELAPLHQPPALDVLARCRETWPSVPSVACFDTSFHATIPVAARTYALPAPYRAEVRAYGFHGLSHAWSASRVAVLAPRARRVLIAHLGGGQSLCGVRDGRSVVTTMGCTPLDGLVMATRPGTLDPGAVLWLAERHPEVDLSHVLEFESGLQGLCGTVDMREVHRRRRAGDPAAELAWEVWRHRAVALAGACVAAMGGLDAVAFTGGIGEHDPLVRAAIVDGLSWLGVTVVDPGPSPAGVAPDDVEELTEAGSSVRVFVVRSREDLRMAAEAALLLGGA